VTPLLAPLIPLADGFVRAPGTGPTTCEGKNDTICIGWALNNLDRWTTPTLEHLMLVVVSVAAGFVIAFGLALLSHRRRWLVPVFVGSTGVLYTVPSIALFLILLPITGFGNVTAIIALTLYSLQIIYRNVVAGFANVPESARNAGRGMGMTQSQLLWKVEVPLSVPEIIAGLRIATVSTIAIATLAVFAGAGGLGGPIYDSLQQNAFKTGIFVPCVILFVMAVLLDSLLLLIQRQLAPWRTRDRRARMRRLAERLPAAP
jgi:osmoprotectant transport system permease protein